MLKSFSTDLSMKFAYFVHGLKHIQCSSILNLFSCRKQKFILEIFKKKYIFNIKGVKVEHHIISFLNMSDKRLHISCKLKHCHIPFVGTLKYLINVHARLLIFNFFSTLHTLITSCTFWEKSSLHF